MKYSLAKEDVKLLVDTIERRYKATQEESSTIKDRKEMFYYPLALALVLFFMGLFSLPRLKKEKKQ